MYRKMSKVGFVVFIFFLCLLILSSTMPTAFAANSVTLDSPASTNLLEKEDCYVYGDYIGSIEYKYNDLGQLSQKLVHDELNGEDFVWEEYNYDQDDLLFEQISYVFINEDYYSDMDIEIGVPTVVTADKIIRHTYFDKYGQIILVKNYTSDGTLTDFVEYDYDSQGRVLLERKVSYDNMTEEKLKGDRAYINHSVSHDPWFDNIEYQINLGYTLNEVGVSTSLNQTFYYDYDNILRCDENAKQAGIIRFFYYDQSNITRIESYKRTGSYIMDLTLIRTSEFTYDDMGNLLQTNHYDANGTLYGYVKIDYSATGKRLCRTAASRGRDIDQNWLDWGAEVCRTYSYDSNDRLVELISYDGDGNESSKTVYNYNNAGRESEATSRSMTTLPYGDASFDRIICESRDGYMLVEKYQETINDVWFEVGVVDRNYNWVVNASRDNKLADDLIFIYNTSFFNTYFGDICRYTYYAGDGIFIYADYKNKAHKQMLSVTEGSWRDIGNVEYYDEDIFKFHDGYIVAHSDSFDGSKIVIISSTGEVKQTDIFCRYANHSPAGNTQCYLSYGLYSEGVFFSNDGFYNINGEKIIDLADYEGQIVNHPFFIDEQAILVAVNAAGTEYEAVINHQGEFLQEFMKR